MAERGVFGFENIINQLSNTPDLQYPQNKKQKKALLNRFKNSTCDNPLKIYVGSCPDYSHENGLYTHQNIGEGVPLLSQVHIEIDSNMLSLLDIANIPYEYILMVADVEAVDEIFSDKFTQGNQEEFLRRCMASSNATQKYLDNEKDRLGLKGVMRSSSFFSEFGYDGFMKTQAKYQGVLAKRYEEDGSFRMRVDGDIITRRQMYEKMYDNVLKSPEINYHEFLKTRDLRTKAQYLALSRLIDASSNNGVIISHPTTNIGLYNDRNKYPLPDDGPQPQSIIPVFEMLRKVY